MWVVPLVGRESGHNKQGEADEDIRSQHVSELMMKSYFAKVSLKKDQNNIGDFVMQEYFVKEWKDSQPNLNSQRIHEAEQTSRFSTWDLKQGNEIRFSIEKQFFF